MVLGKDRKAVGVRQHYHMFGPDPHWLPVHYLINYFLNKLPLISEARIWQLVIPV